MTLQAAGITEDPGACDTNRVVNVIIVDNKRFSEADVAMLKAVGNTLGGSEEGVRVSYIDWRDVKGAAAQVSSVSKPHEHVPAQHFVAVQSKTRRQAMLHHQTTVRRCFSSCQAGVGFKRGAPIVDIDAYVPRLPGGVACSPVLPCRFFQDPRGGRGRRLRVRARDCHHVRQDSEQPRCSLAQRRSAGTNSRPAPLAALQTVTDIVLAPGRDQHLWRG